MQATTTYPAPAACVSDPVTPSESDWISLSYLAAARARGAADPDCLSPQRIAELESEYGKTLTRLIGLHRERIARDAEPQFRVAGAGDRCPLSEFIAANADDPDVIEWARGAKVGDVYRGGGEFCYREA